MNIKNTFGYQFEKAEKQGNATILHMINKTGYGSLTYRNILQGIDLTYDHIYMESFWKKRKKDEEKIIQINHCLKGQFIFTMENGRKYHMNEGDICIYDASFGETIKSKIPDKCYQGFSVRINPKEMRELIKTCKMTEDMDFTLLTEKIKNEGGPLLLRACALPAKLTDEIYLIENCNKNSIYLLKIMELMVNLCDFFKEKKVNFNKYSLDMLNTVRKIHDMILTDPLKDVSVKELVKEFLLPRTGFIQCFKELYGMPPATFMRVVKMKYAAKEMLNCPNMSIRNMATLMGYDNQSKFAAAFKAQWGVTPLVYKKMNSYEVEQMEQKIENLE